MHAKSLQLCLTLWDPMDYSLPGSAIHGIQQARILEWVTMPSSLGIFPTQESNLGLWHCREILYCWATGVIYITSPSWPFLLPSPSHLPAELPVLKSSIPLGHFKKWEQLCLVIFTLFLYSTIQENIFLLPSDAFSFVPWCFPVFVSFLGFPHLRNHTVLILL